MSRLSLWSSSHHSMQILSSSSGQSLLRLKEKEICHNFLGLWARPTMSVWRVVWFPPRLAPDHMLGFGIGRNIWYPVLRKINRIRITIWKVCDKRYPAKSYDQISY